MPSFGHVVAVVDRPLGTTLAVPVEAGAEALTVDDVSRLTWPLGGMRIGNEFHTYLADAAPVQTVDVVDLDEDEPDSDEEGTLTIAPPLIGSYDIDEPVIQYQQSAVIERVATVLMPDQSEELVLRVPRGLWDRLPEGIRQRDLAPETVALEDVEGEWVMTDVVAEDPSIDATFINYATLPTKQGFFDAGAAHNNTAFFAESWANPTRVTTSADNDWATAVGTSTTATVTAHTTSFRLPGTAANNSGTGSLSWSDAANIEAKSPSPPVPGVPPASLSTSAFSSIGTGNTQRLWATGFGFNVPAGATITGITVEVTRAAATATAVFDVIVKLIKGGTIVGSDASSAAAWPTNFTETIYGGDLWGTTWTPAEVNDPDFGFSIQALHASATYAMVDAVRLRVNYTTTSLTAHRSNTYFLMATGYNFALPDTALITAITVQVERHASDDSGDDYAVDNQIRVSAAGDLSATRANSAHWPTSDRVISYGGDLWGFNDLTPDDINASDFGVWLSANVNAGVTVSVDRIKVEVAYVIDTTQDTSLGKLLDITGPGEPPPPPPPPPPVPDLLLLESDDGLLLETDDRVLIESGTSIPPIEFTLLESGDHELLESGDFSGLETE